MLSRKPCSSVSGRKIGSWVPSWKILRELFCFSYSAIISLNRKRASRVIIPLGFWVVNAVFCRLQPSLGHVRRSVPRPCSAMTSNFDVPVAEWERGGTTLQWEQGWGLLETATWAASLPCHLGFLVSVVWGVLLAFLSGKVVCLLFTLFFRPGPSDLRIIMNVNGPGFSLWWFQIPCDSRAQSMWFIG